MNCIPCSGSAQVWEQLCSPWDSNSDTLCVTTDHEAAPYSTHPPVPRTLTFYCERNSKSFHDFILKNKFFDKITFLWCVGNSDSLEKANAEIEVLKSESKSKVFSVF